jgi:hypothetical protein
VTGLGDEEVAAPAENPHRFLFHQPDAFVGVVGINPDQPALGFGDDLLRDDDHVGIGQLDMTGDESRQIVSLPNLSYARHRDNGEGPGCTVIGHERSPLPLSAVIRSGCH